ncbi:MULTISPECIES: phosphoglucosamine mutase [unclassified Veillonella]|jgi:phosphoglucosamine mutase|uniref:phosphoglucosamine mutase n=1 Tax=unclassified Veillonella TaxID=2630086 RepID=UPI000780FF92|nr:MULTISPECIES: phosphoglucosamine mutase [unclassified Veillonella]KXB88413.1 phosphoglucosamine mutase [Veillonella sp. DNF00869]
MSRLFGTDGVRGLVNEFLTPELAYHLGRAAASYFGQSVDRPTFLIGRDTRISGGMLENALASGICAVGGDVIILGEAPTPAIAYLVRQKGCTAGVVISASHNPYPDNGIKFFDGNGFKLPDAVEDEIEKLCTASADDCLPRPTKGDIGQIFYHQDWVEEYVNFVVSTSDMLTGLKVVYDGAHGAASYVGPKILRQLGAEVVAINVTPTGTNINDNAGSTHLEGLQEAVLREGAQVGIANDGDADRCLMVDEKGQVLDGDQIMLLCGLHLKEQGKLKENMIVGTVMSNIGFHKAAKELGMQTCSTAVGDRYVLEKMLAEGYSIGGEQSGHVIFLDYNSTGDGLLTAVQTLSIMKEKGKSLSELAGLMTKYPQLLVNVRVLTKAGWETNTAIQDVIREAEEELGANGRILVRPSGTEPLIRVMAEGPEQEQLDELCHRIGHVIRIEQGEA